MFPTFSQLIIFIYIYYIHTGSWKLLPITGSEFSPHLPNRSVPGWKCSPGPVSSCKGTSWDSTREAERQGHLFFPGVPLDGPFQIFQYYTRITNGVFNIGGKRMTVEIRCQTQLQLGTGPAIAGPQPGKRCSKSILIHCIAGSGRGLPVRIRELLWHVERSCGWQLNIEWQRFAMLTSDMVTRQIRTNQLLHLDFIPNSQVDVHICSPHCAATHSGVFAAIQCRSLLQLLLTPWLKHGSSQSWAELVKKAGKVDEKQVGITSGSHFFICSRHARRRNKMK